MSDISATPVTSIGPHTAARPVTLDTGGTPCAGTGNLRTTEGLPSQDTQTVTRANTTTTSLRTTENARVSQSRLTMLDHRTQPQGPAAFGIMLLAAMLLSGGEDKEESNPLKLMLGMALLSGLQQQLQGGSFVEFQSQSYEFSQSITGSDSAGSSGAAYQQSCAQQGGQIDVQA